jgi:hypothetical protein
MAWIIALVRSDTKSEMTIYYFESLWDQRIVTFTSSTKYWQTSASWGLCQRLVFFYQILTDFSKLRIMSEVVLLLLNTDRLQQVEDYIRGWSSSTKYWQTSASWGLCQRLFFFYQILTDFSKLRIMSEVVLLLLNTDSLQQVEDYIRGCTWQ